MEKFRIGQAVRLTKRWAFIEPALAGKTGHVVAWYRQLGRDGKGWALVAFSPQTAKGLSLHDGNGQADRETRAAWAGRCWYVPADGLRAVPAKVYDMSKVTPVFNSSGVLEGYRKR